MILVVLLPRWLVVYGKIMNSTNMDADLLALIVVPLFACLIFYIMSYNLCKSIKGIVRKIDSLHILRLTMSFLILWWISSVIVFIHKYGYYKYFGILSIIIIILTGGLFFILRSWYFAWRRYALPEPDPEVPAKPRLHWRQRIMAGRPRTVFQWAVFIWAFVCVVGSLFVVIKKVI